MDHPALLRRTIYAALRSPGITAIVRYLTGPPLRSAISARLRECGIDVTIITADSCEEHAPYRSARLVWQLPSGGEFEIQEIE
jgi:hypothetical protein